MIGIALLLALFICVSSIFFKELRKLAFSIIVTAVVFIGGSWLLLEIITK